MNAAAVRTTLRQGRMHGEVGGGVLIQSPHRSLNLLRLLYDIHDILCIFLTMERILVVESQPPAGTGRLGRL